MIEIKFRVWDKVDKRMIVHEQDFIPLKVTNIGVFKLDPLIEENRWILMEQDRFEIMQNTGLKDKKGRELYVGDIVKAYKHNEYEFVREIIFSHGSFVFGNWWWCEFLNIFRDVEVIGNIYENPELLETK